MFVNHFSNSNKTVSHISKIFTRLLNHLTYLLKEVTSQPQGFLFQKFLVSCLLSVPLPPFRYTPQASTFLVQLSTSVSIYSSHTNFYLLCMFMNSKEYKKVSYKGGRKYKCCYFVIATIYSEAKIGPQFANHSYTDIISLLGSSKEH